MHPGWYKQWTVGFLIPARKARWYRNVFLRFERKRWGEQSNSRSGMQTMPNGPDSIVIYQRHTRIQYIMRLWCSSDVGISLFPFIWELFPAPKNAEPEVFATAEERERETDRKKEKKKETKRERNDINKEQKGKKKTNKNRKRVPLL